MTKKNLKGRKGAARMRITIKLEKTGVRIFRENTDFREKE